MNRTDGRGVGRAFARHEAAMNSNGQLYTDGRICFSYGDHWPLAAWIDGRPVICDDKYSTTTSKHRSFIISGFVNVYMGSGKTGQDDFWSEVVRARFVPTIEEMKQICRDAGLMS